MIRDTLDEYNRLLSRAADILGVVSRVRPSDFSKLKISYPTPNKTVSIYYNGEERVRNLPESCFSKDDNIANLQLSRFLPLIMKDELDRVATIMKEVQADTEKEFNK